MSTHRRAWKQRAGVVVALVAGALLAVPATPALAASVEVSPTSVTVNAGSDATVTVRVTGGNEDKDNKGKISLSGLPSGVTCAGGCGDFDFSGGLGNPTKSVLVRIAANDSAGDANATVTVAVEAESGPSTASLALTVKGKAAPPPQKQTVQSVSGKVVVQADSKAVPNAVVMLLDSTGKRFDTTSDGSGNFRFTGTTSNPIAPGRLDLGASFDNVVARKTINAAAGQALTGQRISLAIKTEVTPSPTPSASTEATPTEEALEEGTEDEASEDASPGAPANASNNEDSGGGAGSYLIILLGGLLVAAGVGTIVLLWMKRKENGGDDDDAVPAGGGPIPPARGGFRGPDDQTRVVGGRPGGADPTMVGGASLSEAPTMMHRPVVDDVPPDPYGAPAPAYGASQQGWGGTGYGDEPAPGGYGAGGYGNAPASGGGYGAGAAAGGYAAGAAGDGYGAAPGSGAGYGSAPTSGGGYGNDPASGGGYGSRDYTAQAGAAGYPPAPAGAGAYGERYDEPTGRYTGDSTQYPAPADPYATGVYQPEQGQGYGQPDSAPPYGGRATEPTAGYGGPAAGGYDQGGYGQPTGGYEQGGGYGQEPPPQRGGYDDRGYDQGGYGQPAGGYEQGGGYGQEPPPQRGGYDDRGYDQGGYGQPAGRSRPDTPPPTERGGRRLDWLDD
ncbi:carboxypeptidase-like regulatory domain-containing protein [Micromonospora sp. WMMD961]|uniref:carboxypeptidase-like regulatory domain-containing protein n=1 Tax=Micromonospora sp. WMMD961 TaxID=3016100 RepID=UPI0024160474|nr:carboxypeptidase-like regulatory domain-containing protein [Micromonospora sp. WMMD961]MDG4778492.1 carboxypeptidase-like regulatory domain-containing protein [Micromonospora sp. WMMD961]